MQIDILTLFPEMFEPVLGTSIIGNAQKEGIVDIKTIQIRDFADNKHNSVDDYPYGGGNGMVMEPGCVQKAIDSAHAELVCYLTPKGRRFDQNLAKLLSKQNHIAFLCGHYEGVDQRVLDESIDLEISLGDFVLTGGEIPVMAVVDSLVRLLPNVLNESQEEAEESFYNGLLEYPQYTRPEEWEIPSLRGNKNSPPSEGWQAKPDGVVRHCEANLSEPWQSSDFNVLKVPEVLLSGHHANIEKWRKEQSIAITKYNRPDLLTPKRVGILGGSFNPLHEGHLDIVHQALELYNLDKILFIPAYEQPFKQGNEKVDAHHRLAMIQIAINNESRFEVSTMEIDRGGISYTIQTLCELKEKYPQNEYFFIIGEDCEPEKWNDYAEMIKLIEFIKLPRRIPISSTDIRNGKFDHIPEKVKKYIKKNKLYELS